MDRTIHYFQDRTDIWIARSTISRIGLTNSNRFRPELSKIVVQIRNTYPEFHEKSKNPKLIPKLDMTLLKKKTNLQIQN